MLSRKPFPVLASRDIAPMRLHMKLEMSVEIGLGLECNSRFSRSTARPLAYTWNNEIVSRLITMAMQVLSKVVFREERCLFAGWPFAAHWCQRCLPLEFSERPTSVSLKKKSYPKCSLWLKAKLPVGPWYGTDLDPCSLKTSSGTKVIWTIGQNSQNHFQSTLK